MADATANVILVIEVGIIALAYLVSLFRNSPRI